MNQASETYMHQDETIVGFVLFLGFKKNLEFPSLVL